MISVQTLLVSCPKCHYTFMKTYIDGPNCCHRTIGGICPHCCFDTEEAKHSAEISARIQQVRERRNP